MSSYKGLLIPGNIFNLYNRPETVSPAGPKGLLVGSQKGQISTTYSKSFNLNGKEVLLPTVINGKFHTDRQAIDRYKLTGEHLGIFDTPENADSYATILHLKQEALGKMIKLLNLKK